MHSGARDVEPVHGHALLISSVCTGERLSSSSICAYSAGSALRPVLWRAPFSSNSLQEHRKPETHLLFRRYKEYLERFKDYNKERELISVKYKAGTIWMFFIGVKEETKCQKK
jgi:hypothetical protein